MSTAVHASIDACVRWRVRAPQHMQACILHAGYIYQRACVQSICICKHPHGRWPEQHRVQQAPHWPGVHASVHACITPNLPPCQCYRRTMHACANTTQVMRACIYPSMHASLHASESSSVSAWARVQSHWLSWPCSVPPNYICMDQHPRSCIVYVCTRMHVGRHANSTISFECTHQGTHGSTLDIFQPMVLQA